MSHIIKHSAILLSCIIALQSLSFDPLFSPEADSQTAVAQGVRRSRKPLGKKGNCQRDRTNGELVAIVPETGTDFTTSRTPTFFFYVPDAPQPTVQATFRVKSNNRNVFPPMPVALSGTPGIIKVQMPQALEKDKEYQWALEISCGAEKTREVQGVFVSRTANDRFLKQLAALSPQQQAALYQKEGFMLDAIAVLANARSNRSSVKEWETLLQALNLPELKQKPIVNCCISTTSSQAR